MAEAVEAVSGTPGPGAQRSDWCEVDWRQHLRSLVWGTADRLVALRDADEFHARIPDARPLVYQHAARVPRIECPAL